MKQLWASILLVFAVIGVAHGMVPKPDAPPQLPDPEPRPVVIVVVQEVPISQPECVHKKVLIWAIFRNIQYGTSLYSAYFAARAIVDPMGLYIPQGGDDDDPDDAGNFCCCKSVVIRFSPGGNNPTGLKIMHSGNTRRIGLLIFVDWTVEGASDFCTYEQDETGVTGAVIGMVNRRRHMVTSPPMGVTEVPSSYVDRVGIVLGGQTVPWGFTGSIGFSGDIKFKCTGTDGVTVEERKQFDLIQNRFNASTHKPKKKLKGF